jgi:hypothetical protein
MQQQQADQEQSNHKTEAQCRCHFVSHTSRAEQQSSTSFRFELFFSLSLTKWNKNGNEPLQQKHQKNKQTIFLF